MSEKLENLRSKFTELTGKQHFAGWDEEQLEKIIAKKEEELAGQEKVPSEEPKENKKEEKPLEATEGVAFDDLPDEERIKEAARINSQTYKTIPDTLTPVFLDGEAFCVIDEKYVPYNEGRIIVQKRKVDIEQAKLEKYEAEIKS